VISDFIPHKIQEDLFCATSIGLWLWVKNDPAALRYVALSPDVKEMAENIYRALWAWSACVIVTVMVSFMTKPRPESELVGAKSVTNIRVHAERISEVRLTRDPTCRLETQPHTAGGNAGLTGTMGDTTMKLSCLPPFPQTLEIAKARRFHTFPPHDDY
jgi:hypothetical protein